MCVCVRERERERRINRELLRLTPRWGTYAESLFLRASFMEDWYRKCFQPGGHLPLWTNVQATWLCWLLTDCQLRLTTGVVNFVVIYFLDAHIYYISVPQPCNLSHAIYVAFPLCLVYLKTQLLILFLKSTLTG